MLQRAFIALTPLVACLATPAHAEVPEAVKAMIEAAIETGDKGKVATVVDFAKQTNPDDVDAIDELHRAFLDDQAELTKAEAAKRKEAIRSAGFFERWSGKGEIGAFRSTGNSENLGLAAGLQLEREGVDWTHKLRANADYQRSNGRTSREKFYAAYEPRLQVNDRLFSYGLVQFDRDRFQGFDGRYAISGGLGYRVVDNSALDLSVKAGPAFRHTDYTSAEDESRIAALLGVDFDWRITDRLTLTQDTNAVAEAGGQAVAIIDSSNTTLNLITGLNAKVSDRLSTRFTYTVDYVSDPPPGAASSDTLSRFTLVYGF